MTNNTPGWLKDLDATVLPMPFGEIEIHVTRHRSMTSKVAYVKESRISPKSNVEAFSDLETLINSMISATFSGKLEFAVDFKGGTIKLITIKNKEIKTYGNQSRLS